MTRDEIRAAVLRQLSDIAPEAELDSLNSTGDLREELDLDSMDFLNFVRTIDQQLHIAVPEPDYPRIVTLEGCVEYLAQRLGAK